MIRKALRIDPRRTGSLDILLVGLSAMLSAFAMCASIGSDKDAFFFICFIAVGMCVSYAMSRYGAKTKFVRWNASIYAAVGVGVMYWSTKGGLNTVLPDNPFSDYALVFAGGVTWLLGIGSFMTWRDNTLLFQAVPCLAMFGLVGCYDTYKEATILFFLFILCLATLMARAHGRLMMKQAESSGHKGVSNLRDGPWRWMAGPEWALASATAVVIISIMGAPIVQEEAKNIGISGLVHLPSPQNQRYIPALFNQRQGLVNVGQGPSSLTRTPVLRVQMQGLNYLRSTSYYEYTGTGWKSYEAGRFSKRIPLAELTREEITNPKTISFSVEMIRPLRFVPFPGQLAELTGDGSNNALRTWDGALETRDTFRNYPKFNGIAIDADYKTNPTSIPKAENPEIQALASDAKVPQAVKDLAIAVTKGAHSDLEKAEAIKAEIDRRCRYNLKANATPAGADPVEYFLFTSHEGYCDLFASAMTTMARSVNIPARYVTGYLPEDEQTDGNYIITEADGHAWSELFFENFGWVTFDATTGAASVEGAKRGDSTEVPWYQTSWWKFGLLPFSCITVLYLGVLAFKRLTTKRAIPYRKELGKVYARFERILQPVAGHPRRLSQTPSEYLDSSRRRLGTLYPRASKLNQEFEEALYGMQEPDEAMIALLKQSVAEFGEETKKNRHLVESGKGKRT